VRILIIEDEKKVAKALRKGLEAQHYDVSIATTGEEGFFLASEGSFDLLLLDLMLPRRDGIDILTMLRKCGIQTPVFVLTAKDAIEDRVLGLDRGADDYLTKPFTLPCCARAATGHAAATPPSSMMNSRRLIQLPRPRGRAEWAGFQG
jgi:two-component system copper resistance phosphate regulon response regulator CusR